MNQSMMPKSSMLQDNLLSAQMFSNRVLGFILAIWLGGSLLLDLVVMPTLYRMGMMGTSSFASTGEALFSSFNSLEILFGAILLVAVLTRRKNRELEAHLSLGGVGLPIVLLAIAFLYRYWLTPQMGSLGIQLDAINPSEVPAAMLMMHTSYWLLEAVKIGACGVLLNRCFRSAL